MTQDLAALMAHAELELVKRGLATRSLLEFIMLFHERGYDAGWFHKNLCQLLDDFIAAVEAKQSPRLILTCPPRHGKSEVVSRKMPAYVLGKHPDWDWISVSYGQDLVDTFGREVRELLNNPVYRDTFGVELDPRTNAADLVKTRCNGMYKATSMGGSLTGLGAHVLCVDDYCKDRQEADSQLQRDRDWDWFSAVALTRLHPGGGVIVTATRWHVDDLIGRILASPTAKDWVVYEFPAIAKHDEPLRKAGEALHPKRYDEKALTNIKNSISPRDWAALYQCSPYVESGAFFKAEHLRTYDTLPDEPINWLVAADYAVSLRTSADCTAIIALGMDHQGNVYVHPTIHYGRFESLESVAKTVKLAKTLKARVLATERGPIQSTLDPSFRREFSEQKWYMTLSRHTRTGSKAVHAHAVRAMMEAGKLFFPSGEFFTHTLRPQMLQFMPESDGADDLIDAMANGMVALESEIVAPPPPKLPDMPEDEIDPKTGRRIWTYDRLTRAARDLRNPLERQASILGLNGKPYKTKPVYGARDGR